MALSASKSRDKSPQNNVSLYYHKKISDCIHLTNRPQYMNNRQKMQVSLAVLFAVLIFFWIFTPVKLSSRILGMTSNALGLIAMIISYRAEEKNKKKNQ